MTPASLALSGISKRYGTVVALDDVSLAVRPGTIHALLGENGAGKTTLMRIAFGLTLPDEGTVRVGGAVVEPGSPARAIRAGVAMVQQHFTLVSAMSVAENLALGTTSAGRLSNETLRLTARFGLPDERTAKVGELPVADQQRIELLKAISRGARVLILDEPTATLPPPEADRLLAWLREFRDRGGSVVLITHKLREALAVADDLSVLRRGVLTYQGAREGASLELVLAAMLGGETTIESDAGAFVGPSPARKELVAEAISVSARDARGIVRLHDASLQVHAGERIGVAGVEGSGARELLQALAGRLEPASGRLTLPDEIGFVPEDRHRDALLLERSIADNVALKGSGRRRGWLRPAASERETARLIAASGIRAQNVRAPVSTLSGGNQQRLILARELSGDPALLVAANPTRGLDVAATREIHHRLAQESRRGMSVIYHSADIDELLEVADRIVVLFEGRVSEVARDRAAVGRAMLGAA